MHVNLEGLDCRESRHGKALHWQPSHVQLMNLGSSSARGEALLHVQQHAEGQGVGACVDTLQSRLCVQSG